MTPFFSTSDEQLMWRVKLEGDSQAFADLMNRWQQPIRNLCTRMVGDVHRAEDLAQAAFVRLYSARASWQPDAKFSTFLWRIALNLCHDELRKLQRRSECSLDELDEDQVSLHGTRADEPAPDAQIERKELAEQVREALLRLAPHYREVIALRHYEHLKFHEIADVLGIPEGTVKSRTAEALTQLNRLLRHLDERNEKKPWNPKNQPRELLAL